MISHEGLCIGNIILYRGEIVTLEAIGKSFCNVSKFKHYQDQLELDIDEFDPAPIDDNILTRFGYVYANENGRKFYWHEDRPGFDIERYEDNEWFFYYHDTDDVLINHEGFKYAHQLQNFHYLIHGTELKLK